MYIVSSTQQQKKQQTKEAYTRLNIFPLLKDVWLFQQHSDKNKTISISSRKPC